jgi:hypothetical protein
MNKTAIAIKKIYVRFQIVLQYSVKNQTLNKIDLINKIINKIQKFVDILLLIL